MCSARSVNKFRIYTRFIFHFEHNEFDFESFRAFNRHGGRRSLSIAPSSFAYESHKQYIRKHWYVVTKHLCGSRPKEFARGEVFRHFPEEIQSVDPRYLKPASGEGDLNRQPSYLFVVSSFGLCAGLLRQREFAEGGFLRSAKFSHVVNALNGIKLDSDLSCSFGGKGFTVNP